MQWHIYYDKSKSLYQLRQSENIMNDVIATFKVFDMAYDYVTRMNCSVNQNSAYSRWVVR
jgi:hypothetical protein